MCTIYGTLAHCHLLLVLLAYLTGAKFDLKDEHGAPKLPCNAQGYIDAFAVADDVLHKVLKEGIKMEIL